jgi:hypothetical protein
MRRASLILMSVAAAVTLVCPASATMRITADRGGLLTAYAERFEAARASGEPVIIDGVCLSACTLAIGMLPRGQVCATPKAVLGFHAAWRPAVNGGKVKSPGATQALYEAYPANVRKWIARRGGLSGRLILWRAVILPRWCHLAAPVPPSAAAVLRGLPYRPNETIVASAEAGAESSSHRGLAKHNLS